MMKEKVNNVLRFAPAGRKGIEFELSPVYTCIPVHGNAEHFIGGRIGV